MSDCCDRPAPATRPGLSWPRRLLRSKAAWTIAAVVGVSLALLAYPESPRKTPADPLAAASSLIVEASVVSMREPEAFDAFISRRALGMSPTVRRCLDGLIAREDEAARTHAESCSIHQDARARNRCQEEDPRRPFRRWLHSLRAATAGKAWTSTDFGSWVASEKARSAKADPQAWQGLPAAMDREAAWRLVDCARQSAPR